MLELPFVMFRCVRRVSVAVLFSPALLDSRSRGSYVVDGALKDFFQMASWAVLFILVYAAVLLAGGVAGYRLAGSRASLISGVGSAGLLVLAYLVARGSAAGTPAAGLWLASGIALALVVVFAIRFSKTKNFHARGHVNNPQRLGAGVLCAGGPRLT